MLISSSQVMHWGVVRRRVCSRLKSITRRCSTTPQQQQQRQPWPNVVEHTEVVELSSQCKLKFKTGHMARFASGSVVLLQEQNAILGVVVSKQQKDPPSSPATDSLTPPPPPPPLQGLALNVDFRRSAAALGRIPTNYLRRELQQTDRDIIASRIIDRSLRPAFYPNYPHQTHIVCNTLALDDAGDAVVLGVNAASAALALSEVPIKCGVAAVRVGLLNGEVLVNPHREILKQSILDMVLVGTGDRERVLMIEMDGKEVTTDAFMQAVDGGLKEITKVESAIGRLAAAAGKQKLAVPSQQPPLPMEMVSECEETLRREVFGNPSHDKISRDLAIQQVKERFLLANPTLFPGHFTDLFKSLLNKWAFEEGEEGQSGKRIDGRSPDQFRTLQMSTSVYEKLHGSALFQRGQTQVFCTLTLDSPQAAFHPDSVAQLLGEQRRKTFMLSYSFPQLAVNEISGGGGGGSAGRREIGHGMLAEKALKHLIPSDFPFTIRLASQVLESNGSSSMAAICAGSLALMDAGVPITSGHVAGVAIGMLRNEEGAVNDGGSTQPSHHLFLVDQLGIEDYYGAMDFKVAGTASGLTAIQMDLKVDGISTQQLAEALQKGRLGIDHLLGQMNECIAHPRLALKPSAPVLEVVDMPSYKMGILFRSAAYNAKLVLAETGVQLSVEDEGRLGFTAPNREKLLQAKQMIEGIMEGSADDSYTFGQLYKAEIVEIMEGGVMVALRKGTRPIFMRNLDLSSKRVGHASALVLEVGQEVIVQYLGRDAYGYHRVSCRALHTTELPIMDLTGRE